MAQTARAVTALRGVRPILLGLLAFGVVAAVLSLTLRATSPTPWMAVMTPKATHYAAHHGDYDTVFLGTSRTFYHVVPDEVEAGAASAGCDSWSVFNYGVFGLRGAELDQLLDEILGTQRPVLERLVIEHPLEPHRKPWEVTNTRGRHFSGPEHWAGSVDAIFSHVESLPRKVFRLGVFAYGAGYDLSGVGRAAGRAFPSAVPIERPEFDMSADGFEALGQEMTDDIQARRDAFLADRDAFERLIASYDTPRDREPVVAAAYALERLDRISAAGLKPAYMATPSLDYLDLTPWIADTVSALRADVPVLNFNRPDAYPDLFERDLWFDTGHLGQDGAKMFSRELGAALCAVDGAG